MGFVSRQVRKVVANGEPHDWYWYQNYFQFQCLMKWRQFRTVVWSDCFWNTRHSISHCLRVIVLMDETETNFYSTRKLNNVFLYIEPIMHYFQIWTTSIITRFRSRYKLLCNSVCYKRSCWLQDLMDTFEHVTDNLGSITKIQKLF